MCMFLHFGLRLDGEIMNRHLFNYLICFLILMLVFHPAHIQAADVKMQTGGGHDTLNQVRDLKKVLLSNQKEPPSWVEPDTDRPGADYRSFHTREGPGVCQEVCADDPKCRAYTYIKPGYYMRHKVIYGWCFLKSAVPEPVKDDCCVSGVKPYKTEKPLTKEVTPGESAAGRGEGGVVLVRPIEPGDNEDVHKKKSPHRKGQEKDKGSKKKYSKKEPPHKVQHPGVHNRRGHHHREKEPSRLREVEKVLEAIDLEHEQGRQTIITIQPFKEKERSPYEGIISAIGRSKNIKPQQNEKTGTTIALYSSSRKSKVFFRNINEVNLEAMPPTGAGKKEISGIDFLSYPSSGSGIRKVENINLSALMTKGSAGRRIIGVNFTAVPPSGTAKRTVTGVNFSGYLPTGSGQREIKGVVILAVPTTGTGLRNASDVTNKK